MERGRQYPTVKPREVCGRNFVDDTHPPVYALLRSQFVFDNGLFSIGVGVTSNKVVKHLTEGRLHWQTQLAGPVQPWLMIAEMVLIAHEPIVRVDFQIEVPFGDFIQGTWFYEPDEFFWGQDGGDLGFPDNVVATGRFTKDLFECHIEVATYSQIP